MSCTIRLLSGRTKDYEDVFFFDDGSDPLPNNPIVMSSALLKLGAVFGTPRVPRPGHVLAMSAWVSLVLGAGIAGENERVELYDTERERHSRVTITNLLFARRLSYHWHRGDKLMPLDVSEWYIRPVSFYHFSIQGNQIHHVYEKSSLCFKERTVLIYPRK